MKRVLSLFIAILVMMTSAFVFSASAAETTSSDFIYFQVPTEGSVAWNNFTTVFCHIWQEGDEGGDFYAWQAKDERCEDLGNGYYRYDISKLTFKEDGTYSLIFSNENGLQTYNLTVTSDCKGDIVVCDGDTCENPVDAEKICAVARWTENKDKVHPCAAISSTGDTLDPDEISGTDVDLTWGSSEGVSIEIPEVVVETEAPTKAESDEDDEDVPDFLKSDTPTDDDDAKDKDSSFPVVPVVIGSVLGVIAIIVVVVIILKKKK